MFWNGSTRPCCRHTNLPQHLWIEGEYMGIKKRGLSSYLLTDLFCQNLSDFFGQSKDDSSHKRNLTDNAQTNLSS